MGREACIIFPNQLFPDHPALQKGRPVWLLESDLFFTQYAFHQKKLVFHRASMKAYADKLEKKGHDVFYIDCMDPRSSLSGLIPYLAANGTQELHCADPVDDWLVKGIKRTAKTYGITYTIYNNPAFFLSQSDIENYQPPASGYLQASFYQQQRKKLGMLLDASGKPLGGKWSFDADNRDRYPAHKQPPPLPKTKKTKYVEDALAWVANTFPGNPGIADDFFYPVMHEEALDWLHDFLQYRFADFGRYEDAMARQHTFLHHSVLSPLINSGLLTPREVMDKALGFASKHEIPLSSVEGFCRQVIGWREFIRMIYIKQGVAQRNGNYWQCNRDIPPSFYTGTTGIAPVDIVIKRVLQHGYCHHIERLMVLGNFMLLSGFHPNQVYRWFMELFIDAYDWVMVPNVYGMSQFADGGLMCTKPYISGSNYIMKMSDFPKGPWQQTWDGLFWNFMHKNREFFLQNPRLGMLIRTFDKMPESKRLAHLQNAEQYLNSL
ncbi:MAG TPA: cryptochrome/photolyase family protein [Chitinophagaceae bacterium]|nr:cryptochrome/photolyase family protein [Chitinophagaceae bacterium]